MKLELSRQFFEKYLNIKFHENPSSGNRFTFRRTDTTKVDIKQGYWATLKTTTIQQPQTTFRNHFRFSEVNDLSKNSRWNHNPQCSHSQRSMTFPKISGATTNPKSDCWYIARWKFLESSFTSVSVSTGDCGCIENFWKGHWPLSI